VTADTINKQVWDIIDTISKNIHVIEGLGDFIKLSAAEPEHCYIEELETKEKNLGKNLEKQKALYEVFSEDKINIDIYKDKAELLRNEEKKFRQDVKVIQLKILEKRNSVDIEKEARDFLLRLKTNPTGKQMDYLVKTFMRIVFKAIYIQNQEIVKLDINQPWKMCYEEGLKCQELENPTPVPQETPEKKKRSRSYYCVPSAAR